MEKKYIENKYYKNLKEINYKQIQKNNNNIEINTQTFLEIFTKIIQKNTPKEKFGILFSGGIDSLLIACICKNLKLNFKCYFAYVEDLGKPKDLEFAEYACEKLNLELVKVPIKYTEMPKTINYVLSQIIMENYIDVISGLPIYYACKQASKEKIKKVIVGCGADELFCGYAKFKDAEDINSLSLNLLKKMEKNNFYRDWKIGELNDIEIIAPYLEKEIIDFSLSLKKEQKLTKKQNKIILRNALKKILPDKKLYERKKTAAQYGGNFDKGVDKLARQARCQGKLEYLNLLKQENNLKLGALYSSGKDSNIALWHMQKQGYDIKCLISIIPETNDSYMYQKPNLKIIIAQSKALGIPLIINRTKGEKEKELKELKQALIEAKKKYNIQGVITGALASNYQRERIQNICKELKLKLFAPLWGMTQENELFELQKNKFEYIMCKISAKGLNKEWLNKKIDYKDIEKLKLFNTKFGFNIAGEGGEYETIVLNAPNFKQKIIIENSKKIMENECTGYLDIKKIKLEKN
ncbi:MAG TPA: diphthine--ammonia ligase [archaeon]|nr:diphthine--ammonia ligase [archaeon]